MQFQTQGYVTSRFIHQGCIKTSQSPKMKNCNVE